MPTCSIWSVSITDPLIIFIKIENTLLDRNISSVVKTALSKVKTKRYLYDPVRAGSVCPTFPTVRVVPNCSGCGSKDIENAHIRDCLLVRRSPMSAVLEFSSSRAFHVSAPSVRDGWTFGTLSIEASKMK